MYQMSKEDIKAMALEGMAETTPPKLQAAGLIDEATPEAAAEHFATNLSQIAGPGSHPRTSMPQAADAGDPTGLTQTPTEAAAGAINYLSRSVPVTQLPGSTKVRIERDDTSTRFNVRFMKSVISHYLCQHH